MTTGTNRISALPCGHKSKWIVLAVWVVLLMVAFPLAGKLTGAQKNDASSWLPKSADSTQVVKQSQKFVPPDTFPAVIVYHRDGAPVTPADEAKAAADAQRFKTVTDHPKGKDKAPKQIVSSVVPPQKAGDGKAIQTIVNVHVGSDGWNTLAPADKDFRAIAQGGGNGLQAHVTGPAGYAGDFAHVFADFDKTLLFITAGIVIIILLITYRSPILWLVPLICVSVALFLAQAVIYVLAKNAGLTVNGQSAFILTVLVFGAGTDYALLLIARYREELRRHEDRHVAMNVALHRAGPAILASGTTVAVSMLCLLVAELNSTKSMGPVMAIGVGVGLAAMVTLLPALLVIFGRWMFWPRRPAFGSSEPTAQGVWARIGTRIAVRPRVTWLATALVLVIMALGLTTLKTDYLANKDAFSSGKPDSVTGEEILVKHFPAGSGSPIEVIAAAAKADAVKTALATVPKVSNVTRIGQPKDGLVYLTGTLNAPPDKPEGFATVDKARSTLHAIPDANAKVGGGAAVTHDINKASKRDQNLIFPIVLIVVLGILALLLRALVAPVILVATVVLSFGAALGFSAVIFDKGFGFAGSDPSFPLWVFVFLVALGTDYNIFLMTRVHEEAKQHGTRRGALIGLAATGGVITSAGLVLAGTFAALGSLPLVFVTEMGFAVAFGVLLDTFVVRSILVTALNLDVGRFMWWPSSLTHEHVDLPAEKDEAASVTP